LRRNPSPELLAVPNRPQAERPPPRGKGKGTIQFEDLGDEVHLWIEQQVPWKVALEILRELKAPAAQDDKPDDE
jgi:hypothetical protein